MAGKEEVVSVVVGEAVVVLVGSYCAAAGAMKSAATTTAKVKSRPIAFERIFKRRESEFGGNTGCRACFAYWGAVHSFGARFDVPTRHVSDIIFTLPFPFTALIDLFNA